MNTRPLLLAFLVSACSTPKMQIAHWPPANSPVVREADGFAVIEHAAVAPTNSSTYRAVFDATRGAEKPTQLVPAFNMAGSELNTLGASGVPLDHAKFVIVVHGGAVDGVLNDAAYRAKFGVDNPNLSVLAALAKNGVELFVCGQQLAADNVDPKSLTPDVKIASDALIVLMKYQNDGYALMSF